jgi:hypothetical protein
MNRIILRKGSLSEYKGKGFAGIFELVKKKHKNDLMLKKLREIVKEGLCFEEELLLYGYKGEDRDLIWSCMEFFYQNLYNLDFKDFIWNDDSDEWENYHFQIKYKDHLSSVESLYRIESTCIIKPAEAVSDKAKVLDLDSISFKVNGDIVYYAN